MAVEFIDGFVISLCLIAIGMILIFAVLQRLWGIGVYKIVKPRPVLIYEGRPWWMENVAPILLLAFSFTLLVEGTFWLFVPSLIPATPLALGLCWFLFLANLAILAPADRKKGSSLQETQNDASGNKEQ